MSREIRGGNCQPPLRAVCTARFASLWEEHRRTLYGQCLLWTRGRHDLAEEVLGRARLRALQSYLDRPRELETPGGWLYRITQNCFLDLRREMLRRREETLTEETVRDPTAPATALGRAALPGPESTALRRELGEVVQRALLHLPPRLRATLVLQVYQELSGREIADHLRINEATVRKRLQEARETLRPLLDGYLGGKSAFPAVPHRQAAKAAVDAEPAEGELEPPAAGFRTLSLLAADGSDRDVVLPLRKWAGDPERRLRTLTGYIESHPSGWKRRLELARLEVQRGELPSALEEYRQVLEKQERHLAATLELIALLDALGRKAEAAALAASAQERATAPADRARLIAEEALLLDDPVRALEILETTGGAGHRRRLARLQVALGQPAAATTTLAPLLRRLPADPEALLIRCDVHLALGRKTDAREDALRALAAAPSCAPALARLVVLDATAGAVAGERGRETAHRLQSLSILAPRAADTAYAHAVWWAEQGERERGRRHLDTLLALRPRLARARFFREIWLHAYGSETGETVPRGLLHPLADYLSGW
jgi:RNA polymerase sigma factor (sigma-70 family)